MSVSAAQARWFFLEALRDGVVWSVSDARGFPTSRNADGASAMPFWSLESRVQTFIAQHRAYADFTPVSIPLADFRERWLPGLTSDGLLLGINWSGARATGYDMRPEEVSARLEGAAPRD